MNERERRRKETQEDKTDRRGERQTEGKTIETGGRRERKAQKKNKQRKTQKKERKQGNLWKVEREKSEWRAEKERISETEGGKIQTHQHC